MKHVIVLTDTAVKGDLVFKGEVIEVDDINAKLLLNYGLVELYVEPEDSPEDEVIDETEKENNDENV